MLDVGVFKQACAKVMFTAEYDHVDIVDNLLMACF